MIHGFDAPSSSIYMTSFDGSNCDCAGADSSNYILRYHGDKPECNRCYTASCGDSTGTSFRCIRSSEDKMGARPATTVVSKNYYQTMSSYLRAKGLTFNQKQTIIPISGKDYYVEDCSGQIANPSNSEDGSQVYQTGSCELGANSCNRTIYKPNNRQFGTQGAVSSSARMELLKYKGRVRSKCARGPKSQSCIVNLPSRSYFAGMQVRPGHHTVC